jgi:hypothetical protein
VPPRTNTAPEGNRTVIDPNAPTGILDPVRPDRWLVPPWPVDAGFGEVVQHFLTSFIWPLSNDSHPARQRAYFVGYQAALLAAPTDDLHRPGALEWRDELLRCVASCVNGQQEQTGGKVRHLPANAPTTIPTPARRERAS